MRLLYNARIATDCSPEAAETLPHSQFAMLPDSTSIQLQKNSNVSRREKDPTSGLTAFIIIVFNLEH